jgi:DNA (cytosine-5)-methyltransferase 1
MRVGSLFSGIGGFDLGFERAGFDITWQVEIDDYANRVLAKHWPHVARYRDVRECGAANLAPVDVICGGFPCQPHSLAGRRLASADERDLWGEFARIIREIRPRWVVAENVSGLLSSEAGRFFGRVLGDLAACGYDAEWDCIPAVTFGADHVRDRVWIVAYPNSHGPQERIHVAPPCCGSSACECARCLADGTHAPAHTADAECRQRPLGRQIGRTGRFWEPIQRHGAWSITSEPVLGRGADGIPDRLDRLRGLGNAIVPQIGEYIARRILQAEERHVA